MTIRPGTLQVDYEVSLSELTLTQDLRSLIGPLPGAERSEWLARYGQVTGPLNARGFLITIDGAPVDLQTRAFDLHVEEHPRYVFHLEAPLPEPERGELTIHDTNYSSSEGTCRLAIRARGGMSITGDDQPSDVEQIPIRPVWQLTDEEERRTKQVRVRFETSTIRSPDELEGPAYEAAGSVQVKGEPPVEGWFVGASEGLSRLLDRRLSGAWLPLLALAASLGAIHALQPGHGKTLVSAVAIGPGARWRQPVVLALAAALTHTGSVLVIAAVLWWTGFSKVGGLHAVLVRVAGFLVAAGGLWRLGRCLGGWAGHHEADTIDPEALSLLGIIGLGMAGGLVPCWDAVSLVVLSAAVGRLAEGVVLVLAFGAGMTVVLVGVGLLATRLKSAMLSTYSAKVWEARLGLVSGLSLTAIGLFFFVA